jgi:hypothetical protein
MVYKQFDIVSTIATRNVIAASDIPMADMTWLGAARPHKNQANVLAMVDQITSFSDPAHEISFSSSPALPAYLPLQLLARRHL